MVEFILSSFYESGNVSRESLADVIGKQTVEDNIICIHEVIRRAKERNAETIAYEICSKAIECMVIDARRRKEDRFYTDALLNLVLSNFVNERDEVKEIIRFDKALKALASI